METTDRQELAVATSLLLTPDASRLFAALNAVAPLASTYPLRFAGEYRELNPLLRLKVESPEAYEAVLGLVEAKRLERGLEPLAEPVDMSFDKNRYQREIMAERRRRTGMAAAIENHDRPPRDKLIGGHRMEFERQQGLRWGEQLETRLNTARQAHGGTITKEQDQEIRDRFWGKVEADLQDGMKQRGLPLKW